MGRIRERGNDGFGGMEGIGDAFKALKEKEEIKDAEIADKLKEESETVVESGEVIPIDKEADSSLADSMYEDPDYIALGEKINDKWLKDNNVIEGSDEHSDYIFNRLDKDAEDEYRALHPEKSKVYDYKKGEDEYEEEDEESERDSQELESSTAEALEEADTVDDVDIDAEEMDKYLDQDDGHVLETGVINDAGAAEQVKEEAEIVDDAGETPSINEETESSLADSMYVDPYYLNIAKELSDTWLARHDSTKGSEQHYDYLRGDHMSDVKNQFKALHPKKYKAYEYKKGEDKHDSKELESSTAEALEGTDDISIEDKGDYLEQGDSISPEDMGSYLERKDSIDPKEYKSLMKEAKAIKKGVDFEGIDPTVKEILGWLILAEIGLGATREYKYIAEEMPGFKSHKNRDIGGNRKKKFGLIDKGIRSARKHKFALATVVPVMVSKFFTTFFWETGKFIFESVDDLLLKPMGIKIKKKKKEEKKGSDKKEKKDKKK